MDFAVPVDHEGKTERKQISTLNSLKNWKKLWNMKVTVIPIVICTLSTVTKWLVQELEDMEIWSEDHPNDNIIKIG